MSEKETKDLQEQVGLLTDQVTDLTGQVSNLTHEVAELTSNMTGMAGNIAKLVELVKGPEVPDPREIKGLTPMQTYVWQRLFIGKDAIATQVSTLWEDRIKLMVVVAFIGFSTPIICELIILGLRYMMHSGH